MRASLRISGRALDRVPEGTVTRARGPRTKRNGPGRMAPGLN